MHKKYEKKTIKKSFFSAKEAQLCYNIDVCIGIPKWGIGDCMGHFMSKNDS